MSCVPKIVKNITSTCETNRIGGIEQDYVVIANRSDLIYTVTGNVVSSLAMKVGTKAYKLTGVKKSLSVGNEGKASDNRPMVFAHWLKFPQFETLAADIANVDAMEDVVVIVENKSKNAGGDGTFNVLGMVSGLHKTASTVDSNADNGVRNLELKSMDQQEEKYSFYTFLDTDYATTKAALEDLLTVAV